mmetsp:Transcript_13502/g.16085  ORF Transcript_13502/g.16085 Transcript_13502/m.16085 type:complete len:99 (+) Transcript_13502:15-311(+)
MAVMKISLLMLLMTANAIKDPCASTAGDGDITSLIPSQNDTNPLCYECPNIKYAECNLELDPLVEEHILEPGSCSDYGYKVYIKNDPVWQESGLYGSV